MSIYRTVIALVGASLMVGVMSTASFAASKEKKGKAEVVRVSSPSDEAEQNNTVYPPVGQCQFVDQKRTRQDGRVFHLKYQVCH
jgi:hypothetical protein